MGDAPVPEAFQTLCARARLRSALCGCACVCLCACMCMHLRRRPGWGGGGERFRGGFPGPGSAPVLLRLASFPPRPPVAGHGPAASRRPRPSVVADVWLCHGNARTGCAAGSQQGQAHAPRPPTPFPLPKALLQRTTRGQVGDGLVFVSGETQSQRPRRVRWPGVGRMCVHTPAESPSPLPPSALQSPAKEAGWGGELPISRV